MFKSGILLGQSGITLPFYEQGITISLVLLGICIMLGTRLGSWGGLALVACFGMLHGNAHGIEVSNGSLSFSATLGLVSATAALLCVGTGLALIIQKSLTGDRAILATRVFGAGIVGAAFTIK